MTHLKVYLYLITTLLLASGCSRHAEEFKDAPVKRDFGPTVPDTPVDLSVALKPLFSAFYPQDKVFSISSKDWFDLGNELLETGGPVASFGNTLIQNFYKLSNSHTLMIGTTNPPGSPYAEAAYRYARPVMTKAYDESIVKAESKVIVAAGKISVPTSDLEKYPPPDVVLERMILGLTQFKEKLLEEKEGDDPVITSISSQIDTKFTLDLSGLKLSAKMEPEIPLITSLKGLESNLGKLTELNDFDREHLLTQVQRGIALTETSDAVKTSDDALGFLVNAWLGKEMRKLFPYTLRNIFASLSDAQVFALGTRNISLIVPESQWPALKEEKDTIILPDRSLTALFLKNNGLVLDAPDWAALQDRVVALDALLKDPQISYFARIVSNTPSDKIEDQRFALINAWLGMSVRLGMPEDLRSIFSALSESDLELIGNNSTPWLAGKMDFTLAKYRYGLIAALDKEGPDSIKKLFNETVASAIRERLDLALLPIARDFSKQVTNALIPILEKNRGDADKVASSSYKDFGRFYLGKLVFGIDGLVKGDSTTEAHDNSILQKYPLPMLEKAHLNFSIQNRNFTPVENSPETSPQVLGLSLAVVSERVDQNPNEAIGVEYQAISKLLAISGYQDSQGHLVESLMAAVTPGHSTEFFDVANYDPTVITFATPDSISIKNQFRMDSSSRSFPKVSVEGQMELLYGYAKLLKFFKPWTKSSFDSGLNAIRIDEAKTMIPFGKNDYFLLNLALGTYILENIPVKMLGLVTSSNQFVDGTKVDTSHVDAVAATVSDYTPNGMSHKVTTQSLARAIMGMSEFYGQVGDLQKSTDPIISAHLKDDGLRLAMENLEKIISGLIFFSMGYLKQDDGGFVSGFDLDKMKPLPGVRALSDQLIMEEALLCAGRNMQSGFMISRAIENFFFLNSKFWKKELGFYRMSESDDRGRVWLIDVARALHNVGLMMQPTDLTRGPNANSLEQMRQLRDLWISRFFGKSTQKLPPVLQVSEFSL